MTRSTVFNGSIRIKSAAALLGQAYLSAFALCNIGSLSPANILSALLFLAMLVLFCCSAKITGTAILPGSFRAVCGLLAFLFSLFYVAAEHQNLTGDFENGAFRLFFLLATALGLFFLFQTCVRILMVMFSSVRPCIGLLFPDAAVFWFLPDCSCAGCPGFFITTPAS